MALSNSERRAFQKAIKSNGAALVERIRCGVYEVPSAGRSGVRHIVTGTSVLASEMACTCEAGQRGLPCWHKAAVQLGKVQENAKQEARRAQQPDPVVTVPTPRAEAVLRFGGQEFRAEGRNLLDAISNVARQRQAA